MVDTKELANCEGFRAILDLWGRGGNEGLSLGEMEGGVDTMGVGA